MRSHREDSYKSSMDSPKAENRNSSDLFYLDLPPIVDLEPYQPNYYSTLVSTSSSIKSQASQVPPSDTKATQVTHGKPRNMRNFQEDQDFDDQAAMNRGHCVQLKPEGGVGVNVASCYCRTPEMCAVSKQFAMCGSHPQTTDTRRTLTYHNSSQPTTVQAQTTLTPQISQQVNQQLTGPMNKRQKMSDIHHGFADYIPLDQTQNQQASIDMVETGSDKQLYSNTITRTDQRDSFHDLHQTTQLLQLQSQANHGASLEQVDAMAMFSSEATNSDRGVNVEKHGMLTSETSGCNLNYKYDEFPNDQGGCNSAVSQPHQFPLNYIWPPSLVIPRRGKWNIDKDAKNTIRKRK